MTEKFEAIVLGVTRHNDKHNIVTVFTRSRGRVVFLSACGSGKSGRLRQSRLQPLAVIEGDMRYSQTAELQKLGSFSLREVWGTLYFHPIKRIEVLFLSEFLNKLLKASMPDENMWDYIVASLRLFDVMDKGIADFHITFMATLLPFVGIQPDASKYEAGMLFDMRAGVFTEHIPPHPDFLQGEEAWFASIIGRINYSNIRVLSLTNEQRKRILQRLLVYYSIHYPGSANLKSLEVIRNM